MGSEAARKTLRDAERAACLDFGRRVQEVMLSKIRLRMNNWTGEKLIGAEVLRNDCASLNLLALLEEGDDA